MAGLPGKESDARLCQRRVSSPLSVDEELPPPAVLNANKRIGGRTRRSRARIPPPTSGKCCATAGGPVQSAAAKREVTTIPETCNTYYAAPESDDRS